MASVVHASSSKYCDSFIHLNVMCLTNYRDLLKLFTTKEIMRWKDVMQTYETELRTKHPGNTIFDPKTEEGQKRWGDLKIRVVEHVGIQYNIL